MNKKLAFVAAIFCVFIITIFFILMADNVIGFHYADVKDNINAYSYLLDNPDEFIPASEDRLFTDGIAIGSAFALAFLIFFIYLANGQLSVILLSGYFLVRSLLLLLLLGVPVTLGTIDFFKLYSFDVPLLVLISELLLMWFALLMFNTKTNAKKAYCLIKVTCWVLVLYLPISFILTIESSFYFSVLIDLFVGLLLLLLGLHLIQKGERLSILFTAFVFTQFIFDLGNAIAILGLNVDVYTQHPYLYSVSFWVSGCFTLFILSRQGYYQIKDKKIAEQKALASLKISEESQTKLLVLQEENQEKLESRVQERTLELNIALQELEIANKELEEKNTLDELTGLFNRRYYDQKVIAEFRRSRRNLTPLSLVIIDIDHFKSVNDTYGHLVGDHCLVWVARKIKQSLGRVTDLGCRYGGEEFCLILPETDTKGAIALAETLRCSIFAEVFVFENKEIPITISCGVSTYWQQGDIEPQDIFAAADQALYSAKKNGRNQVQKKILTGAVES